MPAACGVMVAGPGGRLKVVRYAPKRPVPDLPFALWMALAKATPLPPLAWAPADDPSQNVLLEHDPPPGV